MIFEAGIRLHLGTFDQPIDDWINTCSPRIYGYPEERIHIVPNMNQIASSV